MPFRFTFPSPAAPESGTSLPSMTERKELKLPWPPFLVGDALLLGAAFLIFWQSNRPMGQWEILAFVACTIAANVTGLIPLVLRYRAAGKLAEADRLRAAVLQIQNIEIIGRQIANATANWQNVQDASVKTVDSARQIGEVVASTARAFSDFIQRANDAEKNHLRLEVEKLRRAENDWLQILVRVLDHVFALYQAGARSGQPSVVQQLGNFQNACRDAARRVGLVPFLAIGGEPFDPKLHQLADSNDSPTVESRIAETIATGFSYQGQLVRPRQRLAQHALRAPLDVLKEPALRLLDADEIVDEQAQGLDSMASNAEARNDACTEPSTCLISSGRSLL